MRKEGEEQLLGATSSVLAASSTEVQPVKEIFVKVVSLGRDGEPKVRFMQQNTVGTITNNKPEEPSNLPE